MRASGNQLEPGEEVIAKLHDHWIVMFMPLLVYLLALCLFIFLLLASFILKTVSFVSGFILLLTSFGILFAGLHFFFLFYLEYTVSSLILTNKRLMEIRFFPIFLDDVTYIELFHVIEIDKRKHGFLQNLLNYGTVCLNIPRRRETVVFQYVRYPSIFMNLLEAIKNNKPLAGGDLKLMGAKCPKKYRFLLKNMKEN